EPGDDFQKAGPGRFSARVQEERDYEALAQALRDSGLMPDHVIHAWSLGHSANDASSRERFRQSQNEGFFSVSYLVKALGRHAGGKKIHVSILSDGIHDVLGTETVAPEKATVLGTCLVIPQE